MIRERKLKLNNRLFFLRIYLTDIAQRQLRHTIQDDIETLVTLQLSSNLHSIKHSLMEAYR
jgi:hypothetical protein